MRTLIEVSLKGSLRNNKLEQIRALEVAQQILHNVPYEVESLKIEYGERRIAGMNIDVLVELKVSDESGSKNTVGIAIEIISSENEIEEATRKLDMLKALGEIEQGYVYVRSLTDTYNDIINKAKNFRRVI